MLAYILQKLPDGADQYIRNSFVDSLVDVLFPEYLANNIVGAQTENPITDMVRAIA